jgi:hypothetical protein
MIDKIISIMSKFVRISEPRITKIAQAPATGSAPVDYGAVVPGITTPANQTPVNTPAMNQAPVNTPAVNPYNMFAKSGVNQTKYVGSAQDNELLRAALSKELGVNMPTFYEAYVKAYGKWDSHPENRINNLNGMKKMQAEQQKKSEQARLQQQQIKDNAYKTNQLNPNNPNNILPNNQKNWAPTNPPNYNNFSKPADPFTGINKP